MVGTAWWLQTAPKNYRKWVYSQQSNKIAHHRTFARANHDAVGSVITLETPWHAGVYFDWWKVGNDDPGVWFKILSRQK